MIRPSAERDKNRNLLGRQPFGALLRADAGRRCAWPLRAELRTGMGMGKVVIGNTLGPRAQA